MFVAYVTMNWIFIYMNVLARWLKNVWDSRQYFIVRGYPGNVSIERHIASITECQRYYPHRATIQT